jgi:hypothetical protein
MVTLDRLDGFSPQSRKTTIKKKKTSLLSYIFISPNRTENK